MQAVLMLGFSIVVVVIVAAALWFALGGGSGAVVSGAGASGRGVGSGSNGRPVRVRKPYAAVKVRSGLDACQAAIEIRDRVLLAGEAPALPLAECDAQQCDCRYVHYDDRRRGDRRSPLLSNDRLIGNAAHEEKRGGDRRKA